MNDSLPSNPTPAARSHIGFKLMLAGMTFLLGLVVVEVVLRIITPPPKPNIVFDVFEKKLHTDHFDDFSQAVDYDPDLFWCLKPNKRLPDDARRIRGVISNGDGLREDHEIPKAKPEGELRVLFLGDSCTFGFGVLHHESIVEETERQLEKRLPGVPVECINAGVPGYTAYQGYEYLLLRGLTYDPDIVITTFGWNDSRTWDTYSDLEHHEAYLREQPPGALKKSALCRRLWKAMHRPENRTNGVVRVPPVEFKQLMQSVRTVSTNHGIRPILAVWPLRGNGTPTTITNLTPYQKVLYEMAASGEIIDLLPVTQKALQTYNTNDLFMDYGHTMPVANALIGEAIADYITTSQVRGAQ